MSFRPARSHAPERRRPSPETAKLGTTCTKVWRMAAGTRSAPDSGDSLIMHWRVEMSAVPLLLIDGHNLLFRACFGTPAQIWSRDPRDKRELTTEFMFFALLRKGINEELPGWPEVVVVFDGQDGSAQRKEADAGYKANRPADDNALKPIRALPSIKAGLDLFATTWVEIDDAEADDVIATLAASCPQRDVLIASVDQDYYQLLRDAGPGHGSVQVLNTARRAGSRLAGPAEVRARHGVDPAQLIAPSVSSSAAV